MERFYLARTLEPRGPIWNFDSACVSSAISLRLGFLICKVGDDTRYFKGSSGLVFLIHLGYVDR